MTEWIDVRKKLPERDGFYLVFIPEDEEYGNIDTISPECS